VTTRHRARRKLSLALGVLVAGVIAFGSLPEASADSPKADAPKVSAPTAEVMVIHATHCSHKNVDPQIGEAPPSLGYECLTLHSKLSMPLPLNQGSTASLPNGRVFHLLHTGRTENNRYKVTASINPADGGAGYVKLADITAEPNKPFNVGGFSYLGGVLVLMVRISP
jgi:hypothetical protein